MPDLPIEQPHTSGEADIGHFTRITRSDGRAGDPVYLELARRSRVAEVITELNRRADISVLLVAAEGIRPDLIRGHLRTDESGVATSLVPEQYGFTEGELPVVLHEDRHSQMAFVVDTVNDLAAEGIVLVGTRAKRDMLAALELHPQSVAFARHLSKDAPEPAPLIVNVTIVTNDGHALLVRRPWDGWRNAGTESLGVEEMFDATDDGDTSISDTAQRGVERLLGSDVAPESSSTFLIARERVRDYQGHLLPGAVVVDVVARLNLDWPEVARRLNERQPEHAAQVMAVRLGDHGTSLKGSQIARFREELAQGHDVANAASLARLETRVLAIAPSDDLVDCSPMVHPTTVARLSALELFALRRTASVV